MSNQEQLPTNEVQQLNSNESLYLDLASQINTEVHQATLNPMQYNISPSLIPESGAALNRNEGVLQKIHGVVRAGEELFGVVEARTWDPNNTSNHTEKFILTRFGKEEGQRATLVGLLEPGSPIDVGRKHQPELDDKTSREHFRIGINNEGKLVIEDLQSSNGTEVLIASKDPDIKPLKGGPLDDFNRWAPKSSFIKEATMNSHVSTEANKASEQAAPAEGLISSVPKSAEEAKAMAVSAEASKQASKEAIRVEKEAEVSNKLKELEEPFDEDERRNLWAYSAGIMNKREAQAQGYGAGSIAHEQEAGQAYRKLSPAGQAVAGQYLQLMQQLNSIRMS